MDEFIGKYRVIRNIGAGGMASVFLASHRDIPNLKNILKKLSDPKLADRFKREAGNLALLDGHAGVCQIKHFFEHRGDFYIVMEYIDGPTLDQLINSDDPPDLKRALEITRSILATLDFAHRKGIIHRDIKPTNIMIDSNGQVKIIDFGIAKGETDLELTQEGTSLGSPRYMAPEQFDPPATVDWVKCDIYAVGVTLYYLLAQKPPFQNANMFDLFAAKQLKDIPPPSYFNSDIPAVLDAVVLKAMASDPAYRYATAAEMEAAFQGMEMTARVKVEGGGDKTMVLTQVNVVDPDIRAASRPTPAPSMSDSRPIPAPSTHPSPAVAPVTPRPKNRRLIFQVLAFAAVVILGTFGFREFWPAHQPDSTPLPQPQPQVRALPVDNTVEGTPVEIKWDAKGDSLGVFTLQLGTDKNFLNPTTKEVFGENHKLEEVLAPDMYFWRVRLGTEDLPGSQWSEIGSFTVAEKEILTVKRDTPISKPPDPIPDLISDPIPDPAKLFEVRIGAKLNGEALVGEYEISVDSKKVLPGPNTFSLTAGDHQVKVVLFLDGTYLEKVETISVPASSDPMRHFVKFNTRD